MVLVLQGLDPYYSRRPAAPVPPRSARDRHPHCLRRGRRAGRSRRLHSPHAAVVHADGTARFQTVTPAQEPSLHRLLGLFGERTGVPCLMNTSFNRRGEPVVCSARDAVEAFRRLLERNRILLQSARRAISRRGEFVAAARGPLNASANRPILPADNWAISAITGKDEQPCHVLER